MENLLHANRVISYILSLVYIYIAPFVHSYSIKSVFILLPYHIRERIADQIDLELLSYDAPKAFLNATLDRKLYS